MRSAAKITVSMGQQAAPEENPILALISCCWDLMKMLIVSLSMTGVDNAGILVPDLITYGYLTQNIFKKTDNVNCKIKV